MFVRDPSTVSHHSGAETKNTRCVSIEGSYDNLNIWLPKKALNHEYNYVQAAHLAYHSPWDTAEQRGFFCMGYTSYPIILHELFFTSWVDSLFYQGWQRDLEFSDLYAHPIEVDSEKLDRKLDR